VTAKEVNDFCFIPPFFPCTFANFHLSMIVFAITKQSVNIKNGLGSLVSAILFESAVNVTVMKRNNNPNLIKI